MKYKFVSKEQARNDWENGRVQIEHLGKGGSWKLTQLCMLCGDKATPSGPSNYYTIIAFGQWGGTETKSSVLPSVPTDKLWEMIFWEYQPQKEIIGYELNGLIEAFSVDEVLRTRYDEFDGRLFIGKDDEAINLAKKLKILDIWFNPIYKQKEVKVELSNGEKATIEDNIVYLQKNTKGTLSITDIQKILDAHNKL